MSSVDETIPVTEDELKERSLAPRVTLDALEANIKNIEYYVHPGSQLTICIVILQNGFTVTGQSACADPANYKKDIGERIALENAKREIWSPMGYALKQEIYLQSQRGQGDTFQDRMKNEKVELDNKLNKLKEFIGGNVHFNDLHEDQKTLLIRQRDAMQSYSDILYARIYMSN